MQKRRLLLAACLFMLATGLVGAWCALTPKSSVSLETFNRLHLLVTLEEATSIIGRPADKVAPGAVGNAAYEWTEDGKTIWILFIENVAQMGYFLEKGKGATVQLGVKGATMIDRPRQVFTHWLDFLP